MTETNETQETKPARRRGRPPESFKPRDIFVVCAGVVEEGKDFDMKLEKIQVDGDKTSTDEQLLAQGRKKFEAEFGVEPSNVLGPFFDRKGNIAQSKKRDSIQVDSDEIKFSSRMASAEYNGWYVTVTYLENPKDAAYVMFKSEVAPDPKSEKKRAKPAPKAVKVSALQNVRQIQG